METLDQSRLRKLIGMMGSDNDFERAAAARKFHQTLTTANVNLDRVTIRQYGEAAAEHSLLVKGQQRERLLGFHIAVLESFVSGRVAEIARFQTSAEEDRRRSGAEPYRSRHYTGGRPGWHRTKNA